MTAVLRVQEQRWQVASFTEVDFGDRIFQIRLRQGYGTGPDPLYRDSIFVCVTQ